MSSANITQYRTWIDHAQSSIKIISPAIDLYPQDEDAAQTVYLDAIGGVEDQILCEYNHSFVPINDPDVNPGIDTNEDEANDD